MMNREDMTVKVCMVGDSAVGKTSLIRRFVFDEFNDKYLATLGTKVTKRELTVPCDPLDSQVDVKLLIFDIIGEKGFRQLLREAYFHGANGLIAVCDVTRGETLDSLEDWINNAHDVAGQVPMHIVANKIDLEGDNAMSESEFSRFCKIFDSPHCFSSAKTGENVEETFDFIARELVNRAMVRRAERK